MSGKLTTHILDTAHGCAAANVSLELWIVERPSDQKTFLKRMTTNNDGRTDIPLLTNGEMQVGVYELVFAVGDYFAQQSVNTTEPPFLDRIPIQFTIADPNAHYHVPLLTSPWSYSTYRGS